MNWLEYPIMRIFHLAIRAIGALFAEPQGEPMGAFTLATD